MNPDINPSEGTNKDVGAGAVTRKTPAFLIAVFVAVTIATVYFYSQVKKLQENPDKVNQAKVTALVERIGKIIELPVGEMPTVATVEDVAPLAGNPFFANAKVGDQVLFYTAARQAYLYDPKANIVVEVASLNLGK